MNIGQQYNKLILSNNNSVTITNTDLIKDICIVNNASRFFILKNGDIWLIYCQFFFTWPDNELGVEGVAPLCT